MVRQKVADMLRLLNEHHAAIKCLEWDNDPTIKIQALLDQAFAGDMGHVEPFQKVKDWVAKWVV
ncbi:hypothetical protein [Spirosoma endophyticum]|uniref:Uncharacterized protein n=1 Tax=Spirosoma endophyticum TaxID=662367 RepID=A0A1I2D4P9_9BACT|nr:hypothetical protein [Spirosoma endophyticum]SFE75527.1 hypothetical protein SAMN05216167_1198 [Spirosoma endophyticum]